MSVWERDRNSVVSLLSKAGDISLAPWTRVSQHSLSSINAAMGPLQLAVTWYKIHHAGEQATHWDIQNKENANLA